MHIPENTKRRLIVGLLLGHCLRRWPNIKPTMGQRFVFAGMYSNLTNKQVILNRCLFMLGQRFRRCTNIKLTLGQCLVFVLVINRVAGLSWLYEKNIIEINAKIIHYFT